MILGVFVALAVAITTAVAPVGPAQAAPTTYVNETFTDANNWMVKLGGWSTNSPAGQYRNCTSAGVCDTTGVTRAWIGFASDATAYTIESDIWIDGAAEECKIIYSNADKNEDYRVDIRRISNQVKLSAPAPGAVVSWTPSGSHTALTGLGTKYHLKVVVTRTLISLYYKKDSDPTSLTLISTIPTSIFPDGKAGVGSFAGTCRFDNFTVNGEEGIGLGTTRLLPVFGYERTEGCNEGPVNGFKPGETLTELACHRPLFQPYNRDSEYWWNNQVEELDHAGITAILAHNRGCATALPTEMHGTGDMCPNQLSKLATAITARTSPIKVGMFDDMPTVGDQVKTELGVPFNWANSAHWQTYLWDKRWARWFATVPSSMWAVKAGTNRPIIAIWRAEGDASQFINRSGNMSLAMDWLRNKVLTTYGVDPYIMVEAPYMSGPISDPTMPGHIDAVFNWFDPATGSGTSAAYNYLGTTAGTTVPAYRNPFSAPGVLTSPGCGAPCREVGRKHGNELISNLMQHRSTNYLLLEGWTNVIESAGYNRSLEGNDLWACTQGHDTNMSDFPSQDLRTLRRFTNPSSTSVTLEAETADTYSSTVGGNPLGFYRISNPTNGTCPVFKSYNDLNVGKLAGTSKTYFVTDAISIGFRDVYLPAGTYKIDVTYASTSAVNLCATVNFVTPSCITAPSTGSLTTFSTIQVNAGVGVRKGLINFFISSSTPASVRIDRVNVHT